MQSRAENVDRATLLERCADSVGDALARRVTRTPDKEAFRYPADRTSENPEWHSISWAETQELAHQAAAGFLALGLRPEQRVTICGTTRIEWIIADLGINCAAGATTTIYPNTAPEDMWYIIEDSDTVILVAEDEKQVAKLAGSELKLNHIIVFDNADQCDDERVISWSEFLKTGQAELAKNPECVTDAIALTAHDTLATLIYTSGTTGRPKGVELRHLSWVYEGVAMRSLHIIEDDSLQYLWLPLSHVFGKCLIAVQLEIGFASAVDGRIDRIVAGLGVVKPTFMCGAPRIFEKVRAAVMTSNSGVKARIARWAFHVGALTHPYRLQGKPLPKVLAARYALADKLVFSKLKEKLGGRLDFFMSGSAKLSPQVQAWFYSAGITLVEGYGSTETSAIACVNEPVIPHFGTVGPITPGVDVKIADDGEILMRGPIITTGYHKLPEETAEAFTDGWFHTGDIGVIDESGYLRITDRKKDLIKTSGGKYIAPAKVESVITANVPYISQVVVVGEGRKHACALVVLDHDLLMKWGQNHDHPDATYEELTQLPEIHASIDRFIQKANERLERWETVKRFAILDHELTVANDGVTPNMKIRRAYVIDEYRQLVDSLYDIEE